MANIAGSRSGGHHRGQHEKVERRPLCLRSWRHAGNLLFQPAVPRIAVYPGYFTNGIESAWSAAACSPGWKHLERTVIVAGSFRFAKRAVGPEVLGGKWIVAFSARTIPPRRSFPATRLPLRRRRFWCRIPEHLFART